MRKITTIVALIFSVGVQAQETVPATGGEATGSGGTASYSVGQVVYTTATGTNGSVAQGAQQPFEISTTIGIEVTEINLELVAYPNPTHNALTLNIGNYNNEKLTYQVYDMQGKVIENGAVKSNFTNISLEGQPVATYFINVTKNNRIIKTFKIVKN
jgi:hypothetical protein